MAEVLGAVASGLAVAEVGLKAGGTVWKLKSLWQEVQEVPETIQDLMKQIEMMDPILSDYETNLHVQGVGLTLVSNSSTRNDPPTNPSAAYGREALNNLRRLVEDLGEAIESEKRRRRTLAKMRVMLKKDTIKRFQERLERAIRLLQWTQVNYLAANAAVVGTMVTDVWTAVTEMQYQQQLIMQQLSNYNASGSTAKPPFPVVSQNVEPSRKHTLDKRKRSQRQSESITMPWAEPSIFGAVVVRKSVDDDTNEATYAVRFQLPKWVSQKVWDITFHRACSGWQGTLSTWNVVPDDSPGMLCARTGDLDGLIDLFNRGLASPRDCTADGETIFYIACDQYHHHIIEYYISINLDKACITAGGEFLSILIMLSADDLPIDTLRRLVVRGLSNTVATEASDLEVLSEPVAVNRASFLRMSTLIFATTIPEVFELVSRTCFPFWQNLPPRRKQEILMLWPFEAASLHDVQSQTVNEFRLLVCPNDPVRKSDVQAWIDDDASLLHQVFSWYLNPPSKGLDREWEELLGEVIEATDDVHRRVELPCAHISEIVDLGKYADLSAFYIGFRSALGWALVAVLNGLLMPAPIPPAEQPNIRRLLKGTVANLQAIMSVLASCGHDLLEFGRQEAAIWLSDDNSDRTVGDALYLGIGDYQDGLPFVRALHYGAEPTDWYFEMDFHYEDYAGDFWYLLENPPPEMFVLPGAWID